MRLTELIEAANSAGGFDNITVILLQHEALT
jgi:serine/threonine protein phosphatase PrpC